MERMTYKALGVLLTYPESALIGALDEIDDVFDKEKLLSRKAYKGIKDLIETMKSTDLLTQQENYVKWFDQTPSLSLHLFEHVHSDSPERGQAMADLSNMYHVNGLKINENELPDYLPVFLEFLSTLSERKSKDMLKKPIDILKSLAKDSREKNSYYHPIFDALVGLVA